MSDNDASWRDPGAAGPTPGPLPPPPLTPQLPPQAPPTAAPHLPSTAPPTVAFTPPPGSASPWSSSADQPQPAPFPSAPPPPPPAGGEAGRRSRVIVAVASLAAVALLVVALALVVRAGGEEAGAGSPDEAAAALFDALENEDLVGLAELLHPGERRTLAEPAFEVVDELVRLDLLDSKIDLSSLGGVDIEFDDLQYRVVEVPGADDLREIIVEGGALRASADGTQLPIGPTLRDRFGDEVDRLDATETSEFDGDPMGGGGPILVEVDGRWYFSIWYTVAEAARRDGGQRVPALADIPAAVGADSPEAAIDALIDAVTDLDLAGIIGMTDPDEAAALYRYAPLFLDDAQDQLDALLDVDMAAARWRIDDIRYDTRTDGNVAYVTVEAFTVNVQVEGIDVDVAYSATELTVDVNADVNADGVRHRFALTIDDGVFTVDGSFDGEPLRAQVTVTDDSITGWGEFDGSRIEGSVTIDPDGVCSRMEIVVDGDRDGGCLEDLAPGGAAGVFGTWLSQASVFTLPTPTLVTTRTNGDWYFSPLLTMAHAGLEYLRNTDAETVATQIDQFEQLLGGS